ncbi:MAG: hypothetical protein J0M20_16810 [Burkholderiales bacterium]|nr:hypothetical protein [Burkholderiales bacterium]
MNPLGLREAAVLDYQSLLLLAGADSGQSAATVLEALSSAWIAAYRQQSGRRGVISAMTFGAFCILFDLEGSDHGDGRGPQPPGVFPRAVAAYGCSSPGRRPRRRDDQRLRQLMPTEPSAHVGRDKGHFIAHSIGGAVIAAETNVFSQRRGLNRGWTADGRVFRSMERHAAERPGTPFFMRPIYLAETDVPDFLEVGILLESGKPWVVLFDNRDSADAALTTEGPHQVGVV